MRRVWSILLFSAATLALSAAVAGAQAPAMAASDGGMWTFDRLPAGDIQTKYGFEITSPWADHLRLSSLRVSTGGSASFVSPRGLVLTNHHVALELVNKLSSEDLDLTAMGYYARRPEDELPCPGATLVQLLAMEDVTARVGAAMKPASSPEEAARLREAEIAAISKEMSASSGLRVDIVSLYGGGRLMAYSYKVYDDIRLVFAPEMRPAYYGGDYDNFTYPRYCLDMAFLRAYENGEPVDSSAHYLRWSPEGPSEGELVFVSGHPGSTARQWPLSRLMHERDTYTPGVLELLRTREAALSEFADLGDAERIAVLDDLFGVRNSIKAFQGQLGGLRDPALWQRKAAEEEQFRKAAGDDPDLDAAFGVYERTRAERDRVFNDLIFPRLDGPLGARALDVVRLGRALAQPEAERPDRYRGDALNQLVQELTSDPGIDARLATLWLRANYESALAMLGRGHDYVKAAFGEGESPAAAAARAVKETVLLRPAGLKALIDSGPEAIGASADPVLLVARIADPIRSAAGARWRRAEAEETEAGAVLARARFRIYGDRDYPDATFTLRLAYGVCKGYELGTTLVPWTTTMYGLYGRHAEMAGRDPFDLPERWLKAERDLDLGTPYNFVSTNDITGGNSGSPVVNRSLELVGLIFDGNIQSLPNRYLYQDDVPRAVSVHSKGMTHALERIYKAHRILDELGL